MEALRERANLLRESLEKSKVTTDKVVSALSSFDRRLTSLDTTMKPIQGKMHNIMRSHDNITKSLKKTEFIVNQFDRIREIEVVIFKGPSDEGLERFLEAMNRLMRIIRFFSVHKNFKTSETVLSQANSLLSKAINMTEIEFHKKMSQNSKPILPDHLYECLSRQIKSSNDEEEAESSEEPTAYKLPTLIVPELIPSLNSLAIKLVLVGRHMDCMKIYRDTRANALRTSLKYLGVQRLGREELQRMEWGDVEAKIPNWIDNMGISVKLLFAAERQLCDEVFQGIEDSYRDQCFAEVTSDSLAILLSFPAIVVKIKKSFEDLLLLLDMYAMMCKLQPEIEALFTGEACSEMLNSVSNLRKRLVENTAETFETFADRVKKDPTQPMPNGRNHLMCSWVMNYIKLLFDYQETWTKLFEEHGKGKEDEENLQFLPAILRIIQSLQNNLEAKAKHCKDSALGHIFMMNNVYYMINTVKNTPNLKELLGDDWIQRKKKIVQQHSNLYRKACCTKLIESLSSQGLVSSSSGGGGSTSFSNNALKDAVKERLKSFNVQLEEIHQKHCLWIVHDEELRENLRLIVAEILLPAYRSFLQKFGSLVENSKTKYIKYTPEDIEKLLGDLFEGKAPA